MRLNSFISDIKNESLLERNIKKCKENELPHLGFKTTVKLIELIEEKL